MSPGAGPVEPVTHPTLGGALLLDYLVDLGSALLSAGCSSYRLEELLTRVAALEGAQADVFAVPTGLFIGIRTPEGQQSLISMVRVKEWKTDLNRLALLDEVLNAVADRQMTIDAARVRLKEIQASPSVWPQWVQWLATMLTSAGTALSLGGNWLDTVLAGAGSLVLRGVMHGLGSRQGARFLENFIGGMVAAAFALIAGLTKRGFSREALVIGIVLPLLPGMVLTTGLAEITHKNLVSGTARLMEAAVTLLSLVFGIALVLGIQGPSATPGDAGAPRWVLVQVLSILAVALAAGIVLGLSKEKLPVALSAGLVVYAMSFITRPMPAAMSSFLMALVLALAANSYARSTLRPSQLLLAPGLLLLVPGSFGFRSLDALLRGNFEAGASQFSEMVMISGALVMGLLVANVVLPSRKIL